MINWPAGMIEYASTLDLSNRIKFSRRMQKAMTDEWKQWMEDEGLDFRKIRWLIEHNADEIPKCPICGKIVRFEYGKTYCSVQCMSKSLDVKEKPSLFARGWWAMEGVRKAGEGMKSE